jgi:hypothetical protein
MNNYTLNDKWARIIGIPLLSFLIPVVLHFKDFLALNELYFFKVFIAFLNTFFLWEGNRKLFFYFRKRYPNYHQTFKRIFHQTFVSIIYTLFISFLVDLICMLKEDFFLFKGFLISLVPTIIISLIYESTFFFLEWKSNVKRTEQLARQQVQSQLDALKSQLDPHFLFNSLNTLAALIEETNNPAQEYLDRLADVYRYVLINREKNTVTVEEEMKFLEAYIFLTKTRFRENLQIENQLKPEIYQKQIAPFSLQLLVENALKHNIISKDKKLHIAILEEDNGKYLSIQNNIQAKQTFEQSTKIGLQNIINRYKLLSSYPVEVIKDAFIFKVKIPLLD